MQKIFEVKIPKITEQEFGIVKTLIKMIYEGNNVDIPINISDPTLFKGSAIDVSNGQMVDVYYTMALAAKNFYDFLQTFAEKDTKIITPNIQNVPNGQKLILDSIQHKAVVDGGVKSIHNFDVTNNDVEVHITTARINAQQRFSFVYNEEKELPQAVIDEALNVYNIALSKDADGNLIISTPYEYSIQLGGVDTLFEDLNGFEKGRIEVTK